jgi:hypothetical protein
MSHQNQHAEDNSKKDFTKNWVSSSRFLFYLLLSGMFINMLSGCYRLYKSRYKGKPDIEIQGSTKYTPEYK